MQGQNLDLLRRLKVDTFSSSALGVGSSSSLEQKSRNTQHALEIGTLTGQSKLSTNIRHYHNVRKVRERKRRKGGRNNLGTNEGVLLEFKPQQGNCQSFKSGNLLQEAEAVSDLKDAVVSILPWVNFDTFLPSLKHTHTISPIRKYCMLNKQFKSDCFSLFYLFGPLFFAFSFTWFSCFPIPNGSLESVLTLICELHMQHSLLLCHQLILPSNQIFTACW